MASLQENNFGHNDDSELQELLDGASGEISKISKEVDSQQQVAVDTSLGLEERLDAFEDIIDSQVGDTSLVRARNIERQVGFRQIFLKFEGGNPTGTQKDRIAFAQAMDAMRRGFDAITIATCGNYGVAMAFAASFAGLRCLIFIPEDYHTKRTVEMTDLNAEIVRVRGDYEVAVEESKAFADREEIYDANPGGSNNMLQFRAYGEIAYEIYDELRDSPAAVAVPVSNGTTLAGIYKGFLSLYRRGKTSRMPRMVAGSSYRNNPIIHAYLTGSATCDDLSPEQIRETRINEPLINWRSLDGNHAVSSIRETEGWAGAASDRKMLDFSRLIREKEGLHVLPASTAGLISLVQRHTKNALPNDRYVVVLTGRKS